MNRVILFLISFLILAGCVNLREPYPIIEYYNLQQEPTLLKGLPLKLPTVMVRRVIVNESIDTPHLLINTEPTSVQKLFYHRWISDVSTISTDFLITRINQSGLLSNGVVRSGSIAIPDYVIEPQLIEMVAFNGSQPGANESYVQVQFKVDVLKRMPDNKLEILYSSSYQQKFVRRKTDIKYIPEAYSRVFSLAVDNIISDLSNVIK
jgi:ABC-type uncharacterized transport system auxiliary subunit